MRGRCDSTQKLMAFYESVQSSWFLEIFCVSNGTGSFTIWHRWRCKGASTLYETKEAEKLKALTELISDQIKIVCPDELRVGRIDSSVCATAVEERVLLKLYKSWQFKFRGKMETIKWTDSLIDLWKLSILTLSAVSLIILTERCLIEKLLILKVAVEFDEFHGQRRECVLELHFRMFGCG